MHAYVLRRKTNLWGDSPADWARRLRDQSGNGHGTSPCHDQPLPSYPSLSPPTMLIRKAWPQASYSSGCYSASSFCCSHLMMGRRAAHPNESVWLGLYALQVSSGAPHCRHSAYAGKLTWGVEAGWVRLKRRHGGRAAVTNGAVSQSHPCSTELAWEWRRFWWPFLGTELHCKTNIWSKQA